MVASIAVAAAVLAVAPAAADAAGRTVTFSYERPQQPQSLNPQPPITQQAEYPQAITVNYDDQAGTLGVHLTIYDAPTWAHTLPYLTVRLNASCDLTTDAPTIIDAAFSYDRYDGTDENGNPTQTVDASAGFRRKDYEGTATGAIVPAPDGFDVTFQHSALVGLGELRCARIEGPQRFSQSGYFAGYQPFELTAENATASFKRLLADKYGAAFSGAAVSWALCPREEFFESGLDDEGTPVALCMAQFRSGPTWRYVSATVEQTEPGPVLGDKPYTRTWTRKWRKLPAKCMRQLRVRGRAWSNDGTCPALMISDLAYTVRKGGKPRRAFWHGTNTAGFQTLASYRCKTRARTVTCTSKLGDAFRWKR
jgi:hypothetical protein